MKLSCEMMTLVKVRIPLNVFKKNTNKETIDSFLSGVKLIQKMRSV